MPHILIVFSSASAAEHLIAGVAAAARAAHAVASLHLEDEVDGCSIVAGPDWTPGSSLLMECRRLAPGLPLRFAAAPANGDVVAIRGEAFVAAIARQRTGCGRDDVLPALFEARMRERLSPPQRKGEALRDLRRADRDILSATGKRGDGIVSRYFNRPVSRAISRRLLGVPGMRPWHASIGTALLGVAMVVALVLGGGAGLVAGGLLFQAASIFDGVDGEMARATFRTSNGGAALDSIIDACTNLAFIGGLTVNVGLSGDLPAASAGAVALATVATGLALIGRRAEVSGASINFDAIKGHFRKDGRGSMLMEFLIHLTMRDFFAAASAAMILAGLAHFLLFAFATVALGWLIVTAAVLARGEFETPRHKGSDQDRRPAQAPATCVCAAPGFIRDLR